MLDRTNNNAGREWTVMFYMAADNPLAPIMVSQLKAIKDAGFQENTDVLVYFDPNELGTPTCLYHVNKKRRDKSENKTLVGDAADSFVRNMLEDDVDLSSAQGEAAMAMANALAHPDTQDAGKSLEVFLNYCAEAHPSKHYVLFLVGHGMVVGNDAFLPDEEPVSGIKLKELGGILKCFKAKVNKVNEAFELLALHSCSMSGIEVAYEVRDTAKYLMASEGLAFVGSWPYRQLLKKLFNTVEWRIANSPKDVATLVKKLYFHSFYNAKDFLLAGYPLELALCNLASTNYEKLTNSLGSLVEGLRTGLPDKAVRNLIQMAHLESQSYFDENYTDVYDFCRCLGLQCTELGLGGTLSQSCSDVMEALKPRAADHADAVVLCSRHFGWKYQYSHGLSIYFPWSAPYEKPMKQIDREGKPRKVFMPEYREYDFTVALGDNSWVRFLEEYFSLTMRASRDTEDGGKKRRDDDDPEGAEVDLMELAENWIDVLKKPAGGLEKPTGGYEKPTGGYGMCVCPSVKNYPKDVV